MKKWLSFVFLLAIAVNYAQEDKPKGDWLINYQIGFGILEATDAYKVNANIQNAFLGKEFLFSEKLGLITGVEFYDVTANFTDTSSGQLFLRNRNLAVPVMLRSYSFVSEKLSFYWDFGLYGNFIMDSRLENVADSFSLRDKGAGFTFGLILNAGLRFNLNEGNNIFLGIGTRGDVLNSFSSSQQEFKLSEVAMINLGWGFKFD
jgi:hypothetical protein